MLKKSQESLVTFFETTSNFVVHANFKLKEVKISFPKSQCCKDSSPIFEDSGLYSDSCIENSDSNSNS